LNISFICWFRVLSIFCSLHSWRSWSWRYHNGLCEDILVSLFGHVSKMSVSVMKLFSGKMQNFHYWIALHKCPIIRIPELSDIRLKKLRCNMKKGVRL
jgi:hypothetical protein